MAGGVLDAHVCGGGSGYDLHQQTINRVLLWYSYGGDMKRILVVDEEDAAHFFKKALCLNGYAVEVAQTVDEGIALFRSNPTDAVMVGNRGATIGEKEAEFFVREVKKISPKTKTAVLVSIEEAVPYYERMDTVDLALLKLISVYELPAVIKRLLDNAPLESKR
jgi:DNA-binding response OmpR family regulator